MIPGNSLAVQWLGLCGPGSIPGQGSKIAQAMLHSQKQTNKANKPKNKKILFQKIVKWGSFYFMFSSWKWGTYVLVSN